MSPFSTPVLGGAALMSAPAWWNAVDGTVSVTYAVTRFLVCVAICWVALEVLTAIVGPAPTPVSPAAEGDDAGGAADDGAEPTADRTQPQQPSLRT